MSSETRCGTLLPAKLYSAVCTKPPLTHNKQRALGHTGPQRTGQALVHLTRSGPGPWCMDEWVHGCMCMGAWCMGQLDKGNGAWVPHCTDCAVPFRYPGAVMYVALEAPQRDLTLPSGRLAPNAQ